MTVEKFSAVDLVFERLGNDGFGGLGLDVVYDALVSECVSGDWVLFGAGSVELSLGVFMEKVRSGMDCWVILDGVGGIVGVTGVELRVFPVEPVSGYYTVTYLIPRVRGVGVNGVAKRFLINVFEGVGLPLISKVNKNNVVSINSLRGSVVSVDTVCFEDDGFIFFVLTSA